MFHGDVIPNFSDCITGTGCFMDKKTEITVIDSPDTHGCSWCKDGLIFRVQNGLGKLVSVCGNADKDYWYISQLRLNDLPIMQGYYPVCPTCFGMLATGYGIDNIKCGELDSIRETLNQNYTGIKAAFESILPLLQLLTDGYYLLADVELAPTDGEKFFYNVPNKLTSNTATCDSYYIDEFCSVTDGYPAFLYPTQTSKSIDDSRVEEYRRRIKQGAEVRGLAYYEKGFICALLDGHHKAIASAQLGEKLKCLTIIPVCECTLENNDLPLAAKKVTSLIFAGLSYKLQKNCSHEEVFPHNANPISVQVQVQEYDLTDKRFADIDKAIKRKYLSTNQICYLDATGITNGSVSEAEIMGWIKSGKGDSWSKLKYIMEYRAVSDYESAYRIAAAIIESNSPRMPRKEAWRILLRKRDSQTEEMAFQYIAEHTPQDECWDVVTDYWEDVPEL